MDTSPEVLALPYACAQLYHMVVGGGLAVKGRMSENLVPSSCRRKAAEGRFRHLKGKRCHLNYVFFFQAVCILIAALLQYFFTAMFCWAVCEALQLLMTLITRKIKNSSRLKVFYIIGWGKCSEDSFCSCCKCSLLSRNTILPYLPILRCLVLPTFARFSF